MQHEGGCCTILASPTYNSNWSDADVYARARAYRHSARVVVKIRIVLKTTNKLGVYNSTKRTAWTRNHYQIVRMSVACFFTHFDNQTEAVTEAYTETAPNTALTASNPFSPRGWLSIQQQLAACLAIMLNARELTFIQHIGKLNHMMEIEPCNILHP